MCGCNCNIVNICRTCNSNSICSCLCYGRRNYKKNIFVFVTVAAGYLFRCYRSCYRTNVSRYNSSISRCRCCCTTNNNSSSCNIGSIVVVVAIAIEADEVVIEPAVALLVFV